MERKKKERMFFGKGRVRKRGIGRLIKGVRKVFRKEKVRKVRQAMKE